MKSYLRFLSRNKLYTAIEVVGLSVALAFVLVLSSYIVNDMSVNRILKDTDDVYLVHSTGRSELFYEVPQLYAAMPEIESSCGMIQSETHTSLFADITTASYGKNSMNVRIMGVSDTFFDFFTFPLSEGDPHNALESKNSVVISEAMANTLFPDGDAVGKEINVVEKNPFGKWSDEPIMDFDVNLVVTGIFKPFAKTIFKEPDLIMSMALIQEKQDAMFQGSMRVVEYGFVKLGDEADPAEVSEKLTKGFLELNPRYDDQYQKLVDLTAFDEIKKQDPKVFSYSFNNIRQGKLFSIYLLMCIFVTIVSLLDYIVLTIAFSRFRIKEIATRQLLGADKKGVIGRCFAEAMILLGVSCFFAVLIAVAFKRPVSQILGTEINPLTQLNEYMILAAIIAIMVALASAVPSYILSSYSAIKVIKGEARYQDKVTFGKVFIGLAGLLSIGALSICFGVIRQTRHILNQPLGYDYDNMVCVEFLSDENRFFDELKSLPFIDKVGSYQNIPTRPALTSLINKGTGKYESIIFIAGNSEYFEMLGIEIIEDNGSGSTDSEYGKWYACRSSYGILDEYMTEGMLNMWQPAPLSGIVNDIKVGRLKENAHSKFTFINVRNLPEVVQYGLPILKVNIDENEAKKMVQEFYYSKGYDDSMFAVENLREKTEKELNEEMNMIKLLVGFSLICLLMTIMTIIGLSNYYAKTTEKNNAVRNVFGCSKKEMVRKIVLDFSLPVVISAFVAVPVAYMVIGRWLEGYVIRSTNSPVVYIGALLVVIAVIVASILLQALRQMRTNPAEALKKE